MKINNTWQKISQFLKFLISVFAGFFLTTIYPIFESLRYKKKELLLL